MVYQNKTLSVVMPAYNEEQVIGKVLSQLDAFDFIDEIVVVDDGSQDGTVAAVEASPVSVKLVQHPYNIGNGAAVKSGIRAASGDLILLMDGDGQHPPSEIPHILQYSDKYDMVVGARTSDSDTHWVRDFGNWVFNTYASYIVGYPVPDLTSGFRLVNASIARSFVYLLPNGFSYPTTLTIALFRAGYAVKYHPFVSPAREGKSKIRPLRDGMRFMLTLTRLATLFVPLKIFIPISLLVMAVSGSYIAWRLIFEGAFSGFGGLMFTIGVFIFLLGLISEQIALLRYINSDR